MRSTKSWQVNKGENGVVFIVVDGEVFRDRLLSHSVKMRNELALAEHHGRKAKYESNRAGRAWRFHLRNNAAKRAAYWRAHNENV